MKKFFLVFVLLFSFSTLFAARNMTFQDARNYCNDLGGRLPTIGELASICDPNKRDMRDTWTLDGSVYSLMTCKAYRPSFRVNEFFCVNK
ncbi:hypothetical protein IKS86_08800 [bacterium]|nr:hypothetical protein [bacterium]